MTTLLHDYENALRALVQQIRCPEDVLRTAWNGWINLATSKDQDEFKKSFSSLLRGFFQINVNNAKIFELIDESDILPDMNEVDETGQLPLTQVIQYVADNQTQIIEFMLKRGADPNKPNRQGQSAIYMAKQYNKPNILSIMSNYKTLQENQELRKNQQELEQKMNQMMEMLQQLGVQNNQLTDLPHKKSKTSTSIGTMQE